MGVGVIKSGTINKDFILSESEVICLDKFVNYFKLQLLYKDNINKSMYFLKKIIISKIL